MVAAVRDEAWLLVPHAFVLSPDPSMSGTQAPKAANSNVPDKPASKFKVALPPNCPPSDTFTPNGVFLRLVEKHTVSAADFKSCDEEGKKKLHKCDHCRWVAVSFYMDGTPAQTIQDMTKFPNLRKMKFLAHINVGPGSGVAKLHDDDKYHLSFWMYDTFAPEKAVAKVVPI